MLRVIKYHWLLALALINCLCVSAAMADIRYNEQSDVGRELKIPVHQWSCSDKPTKGIVVANQGLVFSGKAYDALAQKLAADGYTVYAQDFRGFGNWVKKTSEFGGDPAVHFTQTKDDLTCLLKQLRKDFPDIPLFVMGESLGANYSIWEASTEPHLMDGVIATSTCFQLKLHPRPLWFKTFAVGVWHPKQLQDIAPYLRPSLSEDRQLTNNCLQDPDVCTMMSATDLVKTLITHRRTLEQLEKIPADMPILLIAGKKDQIQNSRKIKSAVRRIGSKQVQVVVLPDRGHLLLEHQAVNPQVAHVVTQWLNKVTAAKLNTTFVVPEVGTGQVADSGQRAE